MNKIIRQIPKETNNPLPNGEYIGKWSSNVITVFHHGIPFKFKTKNNVKGIDIDVVVYLTHSDMCFAIIEQTTQPIIEEIPTEDLNPLPNGTYIGTWGGNQISVDYKGVLYRYETVNGVRGFNYKVSVTIKDDDISYQQLKN